MNRFVLPLFLAACWSSIAAQAQQSPSGSQRNARPNIVVILADDLGYGDLSCFGAKDIATPNLDKMAAEGMRFTSFYVAQPVCTASRAALLTGCYSNRVGMGGALNHTSTNGIHPGETLLSNVLSNAGYATAAYGKWHLGHHATYWPTSRGFDEFFGIPYSNDNGPLHPVVKGMPPLPLYETELVVEQDPDQSQFTRRLTDRAVKFIEKNREKPFFLYLPHIMPHVPIFASERWRHSSARGLYGDVVQELDSSVGEVLSALKRNGLDENTIVIFTSDNGPFLSYGAHAGSAGPFRGGKLTTFEGGVRMPCIVRWPAKVPSGRVSDSIVTSMDLFTTLAHFGGGQLPETKVDGVDLTGLFLGEAAATERQEFWYYSGDELQAVRSGKWKLHLPHEYLNVAAEPGKDGRPSNWENIKPDSIEESGIRGIASRHGYRVEKMALSLYDLAADPGETSDVSSLHPGEVAALQAVVKRARTDLGDTLTVGIGPGVRPSWNVLPQVSSGVKRISNLEYSRTESGPLMLDLYVPSKTPEAPMPLVVWIHGGGWSFGCKEEHCLLSWLAEEGVAVASINYRLLHQARWPAQIEDCRVAVAWLRNSVTQFHLDPDRIAVAGASAGGHLAALLGTLNLPKGERVRAVVDFFGPSDLLTMPSNLSGNGRTDANLAATRGALLLGGIVRERSILAKQASALYQVSEVSAPFLILHGQKDALVPLDQSERLNAALQQAGVESELELLQGVGHGGWQFDTPEVRAKIRAFLQRHFTN
ncbi:MAG: sulfatase-like hydrolase/transferase [Verrucomicrobiota bacterium]